jgi:hypothetical protein
MADGVVRRPESEATHATAIGQSASEINVSVRVTFCRAINWKNIDLPVGIEKRSVTDAPYRCSPPPSCRDSQAQHEGGSETQ